MENQFISIVKPKRPNMHKTVTDEEMKVFDKHSDYLKEKFKEGIVTFVGTSFEEGQDHFGLVVLNAGSKQEAEEFMSNDPAVNAGLLISNLTEFDTFLSK